jgi:hypothetical protein
MKKFEYMKVTVNADVDMIEVLNHYGDLGWEISPISASPTHYTASCLFKREKNQAKYGKV